MATRQDGSAGPAEPRRWRLDEREQTAPDDRAKATPRSGRRAVVALVAAVLSLWLGLDLAFRGWKERYRALAEFGASMVAPAIDPLASNVPPDVPPGDWQVAVSDTHAMLLALTGAGVLERSQMDALRRDIAARVALARPETARQALADLWDDLERQAGPLIAPDRTPPPANSRHAARHPRPPRPKLLGPPSQIR